MAGGSGERFWPMSRKKTPKHLLPIVGKQTMIRQTVARLRGLIPPERVLILTQSYQIAALRKQCPEIPKANFYAEPMRRDTAPAAGLGGILMERRDPNAVFAVLPADAYVKDAAAFRKTLKIALETAAKNPVIATVGIVPTRAATVYGYLKTKKTLCEKQGVFGVERFVEKPDAKTAEKYLAQGNYFWNAGIFAWSVPTLKDAFKRHCPALARPLEKLSKSKNFAKDLTKVYPTLERISVDYAVMEKADNIVMVRAQFDWDDVGEWTAVARHQPHDDKGNVLRATAATQEASDNIVYGGQRHLIALCGVKGLVVVHTPDATLIADKAHLGELKALLAKVPDKHK